MGAASSIERSSDGSGAVVESVIEIDTPAVRMGVAVDSTGVTESITPTRFNFAHPVYLQNEVEYALAIETDSIDYKLWSSRLGETDVSSGVSVSTQPLLGSVYKSQNTDNWTQDIFEDDKCVIKECFIKLKTPNGKIIHQKTYMKVLDKLGLMLDYDLMILEENIAKCCDNSKEIFAMNISPSSLRNPSFIFKAKELLSSKKNRLIFLLSESHYYSQINKFNFTLKTLRDMGVMIAIDRLGSIHTSFLYLRDLDIDIVRYDSFYTKDIVDEKYKSIIDGFNVMAHNKGVKTWIKMVESQDIKDEAKNLKIDYIQGNFMAPVIKKYEN